jgi:2,4-dienoyl-CoA reductase [(3E)-enoyl-CoA-producing], peroxisomal
MERLVSSVRRVDAFKSEPLGRFGSVRDIADATVYLFSDAGSYVSGQTLVGKVSILNDPFHKDKGKLVAKTEYPVMFTRPKETQTDFSTFFYTVDGASWRLGSIGRGQNYPDSLLSATTFTNVKGMKQSKL